MGSGRDRPYLAIVWSVFCPHSVVLPLPYHTTSVPLNDDHTTPAPAMSGHTAPGPAVFDQHAVISRGVSRIPAEHRHTREGAITRCMLAANLLMKRQKQLEHKT